MLSLIKYLACLFLSLLFACSYYPEGTGGPGVQKKVNLDSDVEKAGLVNEVESAWDDKTMVFTLKDGMKVTACISFQKGGESKIYKVKTNDIKKGSLKLKMVTDKTLEFLVDNQLVFTFKSDLKISSSKKMTSYSGEVVEENEETQRFYLLIEDEFCDEGKNVESSGGSNSETKANNNTNANEKSTESKTITTNKSTKTTQTLYNPDNSSDKDILVTLMDAWEGKDLVLGKKHCVEFSTREGECTHYSIPVTSLFTKTGMCKLKMINITNTIMYNLKKPDDDKFKFFTSTKFTKETLESLKGDETSIETDDDYTLLVKEKGYCKDNYKDPNADADDSPSDSNDSQPADSGGSEPSTSSPDFTVENVREAWDGKSVGFAAGTQKWCFEFKTAANCKWHFKIQNKAVRDVDNCDIKIEDGKVGILFKDQYFGDKWAKIEWDGDPKPSDTTVTGKVAGEGIWINSASSYCESTFTYD